MSEVAKKSKAKKKRCGDCKFVDKSKGDANWSCTSESAIEDKKAKTPPFFPRVFTNDKCNYFEPGPDEAEQESAS